MRHRTRPKIGTLELRRTEDGVSTGYLNLNVLILQMQVAIVGTRKNRLCIVYKLILLIRAN